MAEPNKEENKPFSISETYGSEAGAVAPKPATQTQTQTQPVAEPPPVNNIGSRTGNLPTAPVPPIPGEFKGTPAPTTDKLKDVRNEEREWEMKKMMLGQLFNMASEQRADQRYWARHEAEQAAAVERRARPWKFTARTNGVTGQSSFKVQWFGDDGRKMSSSNPGAVFGGGAGGLGGPDSVMGMINALLGGKDGSGSAGSRSSGRGRVNKGAEPGAEKDDGIALLSHQSWMPRDTDKKGRRFYDNDFLALGDRKDSGRFQGGYRDPAFRENFIKERVGKLKPGDAGYDRAVESANAAWGKAASAYDKMFAAYGKGLLYYQGKRASEAQEKSVREAVEGYQKALKGGTPVRDEEAAAAAVKKSIDAENGSRAVGAMGSRVVGPKRRRY